MRQIKLENKSSNEFKFDLAQIPKDFNIDYENSYFYYQNDIPNVEDRQYILINPLVYKQAPKIDSMYLSHYNSTSEKIIHNRLVCDDDYYINNVEPDFINTDADMLVATSWKKDQIIY